VGLSAPQAPSFPGVPPRVGAGRKKREERRKKGAKEGGAGREGARDAREGERENSQGGEGEPSRVARERERERDRAFYHKRVIHLSGQKTALYRPLLDKRQLPGARTPAPGLGPGKPKKRMPVSHSENFGWSGFTIHPRVRPAENGGEFSVLCFQPVALPRALCAQVARASAQATMATAHSGSARDRHWRAGPSGPSAQSRHTPPARVTGGRDPARDKLAGARTLPRALHPEPKRHHIRIEALPPVRARGPDRNDHLWDPAADCGGPCIPLRSGSYDSSSMVKGPS